MFLVRVFSFTLSFLIMSTRCGTIQKPFKFSSFFIAIIFFFTVIFQPVLWMIHLPLGYGHNASLVQFIARLASGIISLAIPATAIGGQNTVLHLL